VALGGREIAGIAGLCLVGFRWHRVSAL